MTIKSQFKDEFLLVVPPCFPRSAGLVTAVTGIPAGVYYSCEVLPEAQG